MKPTSILALLAFAGLGLIGSRVNAADLTYTPGDLLLGVRATAGTGAGKDYLVNLGPAASFYTNSSAGAPFAVSGLGNMVADLNATFGSNWSTRTDLFWSVSGANTNGTVATAGEPGRTLFATKPQGTVGTPNADRWLRGTSSAQSGPAGKMIDMATYFAKTNGGSPAVKSSANNPRGLVQNIGDINSYAAYHAGGASNGISTATFSYFDPTIEGTTSSTLELYRLNPGAGPTVGTAGELLGFFSLDKSGAVLFNPAANVANPNIATGASTVSFKSANYRVIETAAATTVDIQVVRGGDLSTAINVPVTLVDGNVVGASTLTTYAGGTVSFAANETQKTISVPVKALLKTGFQADRTFKLHLGTVANVTSGADTTVGIRDNGKGAVGFLAGSVTVQSTLDGTTPNTAVVTVTRASGDNGDVSVSLGLPATTGTLAIGTDYTFAPTTVTLFDGETSKTISIPLVSPTTAGTIKLALTSPVGGATLGTAAATITVARDASAPTITFPGTPFPAVSTTLTGATLAAFQGTAKDSGTAGAAPGVVKVEYAVNSGAYAVASLGTPGGTPTTFNVPQLTLENGANVLSIRATDKVGNVSTTVKNISVSNSAFGGTVAGTYEGIVLASGANPQVSNDTTGLITITVTGTGSLSGKLTVGGISKSFSGLLKFDGTARFKNPTILADYIDVIDTAEFDSYLGALSFNVPSGGAPVTGTLKTSGTGTEIASFTAKQTPFKSSAPVQPGDGLLNAGTKGTYNVAILSPGVAGTPTGDGAATVAVTASGAVTFKGYLADGTAFTAAGKLTAGANSTASPYQAAVHGNLYKKAGAIATVLSFNKDLTNTDVTASVTWIRPAQPRAVYFKDGWPTGATASAIGTAYATTDLVIGQGAQAAPTANAQLALTSGALSPALSLGVNLSPVGAVKLPTGATYKLSLTASTGLFSGSFVHNVYGTTSLYKGVVLNKGTLDAADRGYGYFLASPATLAYGQAGTSGKVELKP